MKITPKMIADVSIGILVLIAICVMLAWVAQGPTKEDIEQHREKMVAPIPVAPQDPIDDHAKIKPKNDAAQKPSDLRTQSNFFKKNKRKRLFGGRLLRGMF